jgi:AraC-like DNA-binding protein
MAFTTLVPAAPLHAPVRMLWDWHFEPSAFRLERILPQPGSSLILNLLEDQTRVYSDDAERHCERSPGAVYSGQFTRSFVIDSREQVAVMGVMLRPGGACAFLRERMDLLGNRHVALEDLVGSSGRALRERLLDAPDAGSRLAVLADWLLRRFRERPLHPAVHQALATFERSPCVERIGGLVDASGLSARRFGTLFREQVGVGAKQYARLKRFRTVVASVQRGERIEWAHVAADCGFHDQPHLVREFRAFAGMTPGAYATQRGQYANHIEL